MSIGGQCVSSIKNSIRQLYNPLNCIAARNVCLMLAQALVLVLFAIFFSSGGGSSSFPSGEEKPEIELCRLQVSSSQSFKYSIFLFLFLVRQVLTVVAIS